MLSIHPMADPRQWTIRNQTHPLRFLPTTVHDIAADRTVQYNNAGPEIRNDHVVEALNETARTVARTETIGGALHASYLSVTKLFSTAYPPQVPWLKKPSKVDRECLLPCARVSGWSRRVEPPSNSWTVVERER